jgi:DNA-binding NtrC family response regulator
MAEQIFKAHILVLDDDQNIQNALSATLSAQGYHVSNFKNASDALEVVRHNTGPLPIDLIISDIRIPEMDGLTFVAKMKQSGTEIPIILMTAFACIETAIQSIRLGAFDFLKKPFTTAELLISVDRALNHRKLVVENRYLSEQINQKWLLSQIVGKSSKMQSLFDLIKRIAPTRATVLISGESGTGKEMVARAIHQNSPLRDKPFIAINCAAIPENLLESELFGHAKGSFTGAHQNRTGLFQEADGGTLFLDEIGDLSLSLQVKLLRVLQDKKIKPVGENTYKQVDVRILAATHRDLKMAIKKEVFREDLYYRLNVITVAIPPLRERQDDIILLAQHFLQKFSALHHISAKRLSKGALAHLTSQKWSGNVRELENAIERAVIISQSAEIQVQDLSIDEVLLVDEFQKPTSSEYLSLNEIEMRYIAFILSKTGGKKEMAARILKIDRTTLHRKVAEYGLLQAKPGDGYEFCEAINTTTPTH